jgi:hypothetical protein
VTRGPDPDEVQRLLDEQRADQLADERSRERWLRRQAGEEGRFVGLLGQLVATRSPITLHTLSGGRHHGHIAGVGRDFCSLVSPGLVVHVPLAAVATVRPAPDAALPEPVLQGVPHPADRLFSELVGRLAEQQPWVTVGLVGGGKPVAGTLTGAGMDVLTLALEGPDARPCYVRLGSVAELSVRVSG